MNYAMPPRRDPRSLDVKAIVYADHPRQVGNLTTASRARREDVQDVVATALCQDTVATVGQRERYAVDIRYPRCLRSNPKPWQ
jgi:hypothetical protein